MSEAIYKIFNKKHNGSSILGSAIPLKAIQLFILIKSKFVTYDFARLMEGAKEVKCSEFGDAIINNM
ncbi:MAG: hypothetical protein Q8K98_00280 [Bacteroidota bacterium]|nr:hypothetical protein [Bacteroidota bacterium]